MTIRAFPLPVLLVGCWIILLGTAVGSAFVLREARTPYNKAFVVVSHAMPKPSDEDRQEQLDKFGPTPESVMGILFDKLESADENDPAMKMFMSQEHGDKWSELIKDMKEGNKKKQQDNEEAEKEED